MELRRIEQYEPEFWEGGKNIAIRAWTYVLVGLGQVNNYKYVAAAIFGIYYTLKLVSPIWIAIMFVVSLPLLALLGHWWLYKGSKTSEFVSTNKGSVVGYSGYNAQIRTIELLEELIKEVKCLKN
jgi:hypothetical protein